MAASGDKLDGVLITIISATLGVVMLCSFALPTIFGDAGIGGLTDLGDKTESIKSTLSVVAIVLVVCLIIPIVRGYNQRR